MEHNAQGAAANSCGSSSLGQAVEGTDHQGQVRQHVRCGGHSVGSVQGEVVNAFDEVSGLHRGKSADDSESRAHQRV